MAGFHLEKIRHLLPALGSSLTSIGLPGWLSSEEPTCQCWRRTETRVPSLGGEDPLEEEMATRSSILAWTIPWTEEPGGIQSVGSQSVGHDLAT